MINVKDITIGQQMKIRRSSYSFNNGRYDPCTVMTIWKNGVIVVKIGTYQMKFDHSGRERGGNGLHFSHLEYLEDGETAESINAENKKSDADRKGKQQQKEARRVLVVADWWLEKGYDIWGSREVREIQNQDVFTIKYDQNGTTYIITFVIKKIEDISGSSIELEATVLSIREERTRAWAVNSHSGTNLEEALFSLFHSLD